MWLAAPSPCSLLHRWLLAASPLESAGHEAAWWSRRRKECVARQGGEKGERSRGVAGPPEGGSTACRSAHRSSLDDVVTLVPRWGAQTALQQERGRRVLAAGWRLLRELAACGRQSTDQGSRSLFFVAGEREVKMSGGGMRMSAVSGCGWVD